MNINTMLKLNQVLDSNPFQPVMVVGNNLDKLKNVVNIVATVDERELHIPTDWKKLLDIKATNNKAYLLISGLDGIDENAQAKFAGLLKDRRAGNYKLPDKAQIVIPIADMNKISDKIKSLCLIWKVK